MRSQSLSIPLCRRPTLSLSRRYIIGAQINLQPLSPEAFGLGEKLLSLPLPLSLSLSLTLSASSQRIRHVSFSIPLLTPQLRVTFSQASTAGVSCSSVASTSSKLVRASQGRIKLYTSFIESAVASRARWVLRNMPRVLASQPAIHPAPAAVAAVPLRLRRNEQGLLLGWLRRKAPGNESFVRILSSVFFVSHFSASVHTVLWCHSQSLIDTLKRKQTMWSNEVREKSRRKTIYTKTWQRKIDK